MASHIPSVNAHLEEFVDKLVQEKGFQDLEPIVLKQVKSDLMDRVGDHINAEILAHLPEEKIGLLNELLDKGNMDKVEAFVAASVPGLEELVTATLIEFRKTYLGL
jgi:hypothetical protein